MYLYFIIPETRWTHRAWGYLGFSRKAILGRAALFEVVPKASNESASFSAYTRDWVKAILGN